MSRAPGMGSWRTGPIGPLEATPWACCAWASGGHSASTAMHSPIACRDFILRISPGHTIWYGAVAPTAAAWKEQSVGHLGCSVEDSVKTGNIIFYKDLHDPWRFTQSNHPDRGVNSN